MLQIQFRMFRRVYSSAGRENEFYRKALRGKSGLCAVGGAQKWPERLVKLEIKDNTSRTAFYLFEVSTILMSIEMGPQISFW